MKDWHQRALELASKGLKAKDIMLKLQEENGDEAPKYSTIKNYVWEHKKNNS